MTAAMCLVTASLTAPRGEGLRVLGDSRRPCEQQQAKAEGLLPVGSKGRPSHPLFKRSGGEESPSIGTGACAGAAPEAPVQRPRAGQGGSLGEALCHSLDFWRAAPGAQAPLGSATDKRMARRLGCLCPYQRFSGPSQTSQRRLPKPSPTLPGSLPWNTIKEHRKGPHQRAGQCGY